MPEARERPLAEQLSLPREGSVRPSIRPYRPTETTRWSVDRPCRNTSQNPTLVHSIPASIPSPSGICSLGSINPYTRLFDPCCMSVCQNLPCCSGAYSKLTPLHGRENGRKHPYKRIEMCMFKPRVFYTLHFLAHEILSLCIVSSLR